MKSKNDSAAKPDRYPNVEKSKFYGIKFDSKREAYHYLDLRDRLKHGHIRDLELQPRIAIVIGGVPVRYYPSGRQMVYQADFRYFDIARGERVIEDVKMASGFLTDIYRFKRALVHTMGLKIEEIR